jgi:hypothetical protein
MTARRPNIEDRLAAIDARLPKPAFEETPGLDALVLNALLGGAPAAGGASAAGAGASGGFAAGFMFAFGGRAPVATTAA